MKFEWRSFGFKKKTGRCLSKGVNEKIVNCELHLSAGPARLDEVFFDSQVWFDSDVEDFYSVNGDFTPSGNTPIHPNSTLQTPERPDKIENSDIEPVVSASDGNKRLSQLFGINDNNLIEIQKLEKLQGNIESQKSLFGSPCASVTSSICSSTERTPTKGLKPKKYKSGCSSPFCIPSIPRSLSFGQKKKRLIPVQV